MCIEVLREWEAKGLRCLNTKNVKPTKTKTRFQLLYDKARKEVLRQMKKTGKRPKPSTITKYHIKEEELKNV